jgi:hypothetical protein
MPIDLIVLSANINASAIYNTLNSSFWCKIECRLTAATMAPLPHVFVSYAEDNPADAQLANALSEQLIYSHNLRLFACVLHAIGGHPQR